MFQFILSVLLTLTYSLHCSGESIVAVEKKSGTLSIVSMEDNAIEQIKVGYLPHEVAVSKTHAFVSNYGHQHVRSSSLSNIPGNSLTMINLLDRSQQSRIDLGHGKCAPHGIEVSQNGDLAYVTCEGRQEIAVVSTQQKRVIKFLRTNQPGSHMLTLGSNNRLYVTNFWIGTLTVIDTISGEILKQLRIGKSTEGIGIAPNGKHLYLTVVESNELLKVALPSLTIESRITLPERTSPIRVLVSNDNSKLIVNHSSANSTGIYDADSLELIREIPVGRQPIGLSLSRKLNRAYVANMKDGSISIIDIERNKLIKNLDLNLASPDGIAVFH